MTETTQDSKPAVGWAPMFIIGLGVALIIMDATIVNVILPSIIADLKISSIDAEWVNAIYSLTFAALLIVMGRLGDRFGRDKIFMLGGVVFGASSILAASATTGSLLITARALQGIGGAMMSPTSLSIVNALYRGKSRAIAFAIYGSIIGGMAAVGPLMGGWLTQTFSWHWSFWINVPFSVLIVWGTWKFVPSSKAEGEVGAPDWTGAILSTVGIAALVFGLIEGRNYGWWNTATDFDFLGRTWTAGSISPVAIAFIMATVTLVWLYIFETRRTNSGKSALIDFDLFKIKTFGLGSFAGLIISLGEFGILFSLPLFMQSVLGWSALGAGGLLASLAVGAFVAAPTAGQLANRRNPRFVMRLGLVLEIVAIVGIAVTISPSSSGWGLGSWLFVYGLGVGYSTAQLTGLILSDIPVEKSGQASGTQSTARQIGAAMGTAILGTILFVSLHNNTQANLSAADPSTGINATLATQIADVVEGSAGTVIPHLGELPFIPSSAVEFAQVQSELAFAAAVSTVGYAAAFFLLLGLLASLALPPGDAHSRETNESEIIHDFE
jgi:EmrB/QacA subfamily drug resistance transporter